jgi:tetratricopeptide (TPR) repeat protein
VIDTKKYFKKVLPHLSNDALNTIIDHIKHGDNCLTYKAVLTAGFLKNNPSLTVEKLITQNFKDSYFSGIISRIDSESNDAIRILKFLSYLHPDEISKKILEKVVTDDTRLNIALQILCNYNLCKIVNPNSGQFGISVHRILQNDIKINCLKSKEDADAVDEKITEILNEMCPFVNSNPDDNWVKARIVFSHIKHITSRTETNKDTSNFADLYFKISNYEKHVNQNFNGALLNMQISLDMRKRLFKGDHDLIATGFNNISLIYQNLGEYEKALKYAQDSLDMTKRLFQGDHDLIAIGLNNISLIYQDLGKYEKALKYAQDSLDMKMRLFKGDHNSIATGLNNISTIYQNLGNYEKALKYAQDSLDMYKKLFKGDHPNIKIVKSNIQQIAKKLNSVKNNS